MKSEETKTRTAIRLTPDSKTDLDSLVHHLAAERPDERTTETYAIRLSLREACKSRRIGRFKSKR